MKTTLGVGISVLSALAAQGKDFDRTELNEWERLSECEEWMHYVRHDYLPAACSGCAVAAKCLGGCREAARVFRGSPLAPDPVCETVKPK